MGGGNLSFEGSEMLRLSYIQNCILTTSSYKNSAIVNRSVRRVVGMWGARNSPLAG